MSILSKENTSQALWSIPANLQWIRAGLVLIFALMTGGMVVFFIVNPKPGTIIRDGQRLAHDIAQAIAQTSEAQLASGAYIPDEGIILYSRITLTDATEARLWASQQLQVHAEGLSAVSKHERLTWVVDHGSNPVQQIIIQVPLHSAADASLYRYVAAPAQSPVLASDTQPNLPPAAEPVSEAQPEPPTAAAPEVVAAPQPTPPAVEPAAISPALVVPQFVDQPTSIFTGGFDVDAAGWLPLAGNWIVENGFYRQLDASGFDYITMLSSETLSHYSLETRFRHVDGNLGAGMIYNAPSLESRAGAQIVDLTDQGTFLRWGRYNDSGEYNYDGGAIVEPAVADGNWHTLRLVTHEDETAIYLDEREIAAIENVSANGYAGLLTSQAQVEFDDVALLVLPTTVTDEEIPQRMQLPLSQLEDNFGDGTADGWQVLAGDWQVIDEAYHQLAADDMALGAISPFHGDAYTVETQMRYLDGNMSAGFLFNMEQPDTVARSQLVSYADEGQAIQWGYFDETGELILENKVLVSNGSDGEWHTLQLAVAQGAATLTLDGEIVAQAVPLVYPNGYVGLFASQGQVAFDNVHMILETQE